MIHKEYGLLVYVDTQPSEKLGSRPDEIASVVGAISNIEGILEGLVQYKKRRAPKRIEIAKRLSEAIINRSVDLNAVACHTSFREIERHGYEILENVSDRVAVRDEETGNYRFKNFTLKRDLALFAAWYAEALVFIGQRAAIWAKAIEVDKVTLVCDHFPGNTSKIMHAVMAATLINESLKQCWDETQRDNNVKISISNMESFKRTGDSDVISRNEHPEMIYADWLAHSHHANENAAAYFDTDTLRDEKYRASIAEPWIQLSKLGKTWNLELGPGLSLDPKNIASWKSEKYEVLD